MDLALLCPFPVGVVAWSAPEPRITVLVKATFALDRDGELMLAAEQRPLDIDHAGATNDDLAVAGDFVPHKERVDVLLIGHAHSDTPSASIDASIEIADMRRSFVAIAPLPTTAIPLSVTHLRSGPPANVPVRVGPLAPRSASRRAHAGDYALDAEGAPQGPLDGDFDFGFFNAAPLPQQLEALPSGAEITLTGLLAGAPRRAVIVPRRRPLVVLVDASVRRAQALGMRCDTVVIDADRAEITLTWRGAFDAAAAPEGALALVAFEPAGTRWSTPEARRHLEHATRSRAEEPPAPRTQRAPRARTTTIVAAENHAPVTPFRRAEPPKTMTLPVFPSPSPNDDPHTMPLVGPQKAITMPFPFAPPPSNPLPFSAPRGGPPFAAPASAPSTRTPYDGRSTIVFEEGTNHDSMPVLPFPEARLSTNDDALPFHAPTHTHDDEVTSFTVATAREPSVLLPFNAPPMPMGETPRPAPQPIMNAPVLAPSPEPLDEPDPPTIPPPAPPGPGIIDEADEYDGPVRTPPLAPMDLLSVDAYATIRAELLIGKQRDVLARHGLTKRAWQTQERMQIEVLEREASMGVTARAEALSASLDRRGIG